MTMIALPFGLFYPVMPQNVNNNIGWGTLAIDAANEAAAMIFQAPVAGDIDTLKFRLSTTVTGATLNVGLYSLDTNGDPDIAGGALGTTTAVVASSDDDKWMTATLSPAVTVTRGQVMSMVVAQPSSSSGNTQVTCTVNNTSSSCAMPYGNHYTGSWAKQAGQRPLFTIGYNGGGTYKIWHFHQWHFGDGTASDSSVIPGTTATTKEAGTMVMLPFRCRVIGAVLCNANSTASDYYMKLYSTPTGTPVELATSPLIDGNIQTNANGDAKHIRFTSAPILERNTKYAIVYTPNVTAGSALKKFIAPSAGDMDNDIGGGSAVYGCFRNSTGSTSFTEETSTRYPIGLWIDAIDDGSPGPTYAIGV